MLKTDMKLWNRDVFGNFDTTKWRILPDLEALDCQDCNGGLGEGEVGKNGIDKPSG